MNNYPTAFFVSILLGSEGGLYVVADTASDELIPAVYAEQEDLCIRLGRILEDLSEIHRQAITLFCLNRLRVE